jgi:hypothetical protein
VEERAVTEDREGPARDGDVAASRPARHRLRSLLSAVAFGLALALAFVAGNRVVIGGALTAVGLSANHVDPFQLIDLVWVLVLTALIGGLVLGAPLLYRWVNALHLRTHVPATRKAGRLLHLWLGAGLAVAWLPMLLTYSPGGASPDTVFSIRQALFAGVSTSWNNRHPVAFALALRPLLAVGTYFHSSNLGVLLATGIQYLFLAAVCSYSIVWLARRRIPVALLVVAYLLFLLVPVFPIFAVGLSVDSLFAALVLLYTLHILDVIESDGKLLGTARGIATFSALSLLVIFCRNNGVLIVVLAAVALSVVYRARLKPFYIAVVLVLGLTAVVQGPVYGLFRVEKPVVEALGVPVQQMAYVVATGGNVTAQDRGFLDSVLPLYRWPLDYAPCYVDPIKGDRSFDDGFVTAHLPQFFGTWLSLLSRNPGSFVNAYLLQTFGYWKPTFAPAALPALPSIANNGVDIHRTDLVARATGRSVAPVYAAASRSWLWQDWPNVVWGVWLAFLSAAVLVALGKGRYLAALVPCFGSWLALMLAAPVAFAFRYLLMFAVCLPLLALLPLIALRDGDPAAADPDMDVDAVG